MKYLGTKPWGQDKDIKIPIFAINRDELKILKSLLQKAQDHTPRVLETIPVLGKIRNMKNAVVDYLSSPQDSSKEKK